jgi:hypothetical protein
MATAAATHSFLPLGNVDSFTIYYIVSSTTFPAGSFNWNIDGGSNTLINNGGTNALGIATVSAGTLGSHTINISWVSGTVQIIGIVGNNSTLKRIIVANAGISGAQSSNWNFFTFPWSNFQQSAYGASLVIIDLGINEMLSAVPVATYTTNMQAVITAAKSTGADVVLKTFIPQQISSISQVTQSQYLAAIASLASSNSLQIIDTNALFVDWVTANGNGYMANANHPQSLGYQAEATYMAGLLF